MIFCPIYFIRLNVVYILMDIKHRVHQHKDREFKMQRLYKSVTGKFVPCAWMCPDCGHIER